MKKTFGWIRNGEYFNFYGLLYMKTGYGIAYCFDRGRTRTLSNESRVWYQPKGQAPKVETGLRESLLEERLSLEKLLRNEEMLAKRLTTIKNLLETV